MASQNLFPLFLPVLHLGGHGPQSRNPSILLDENNEFIVSEITTGWETGTYHASVYYFDPENNNKKTEVRVYFDVINLNE